MALFELKMKYPNAVTFRFGDSEELCHHLISLVRSGKKKASCEALRVFESEGEILPEVGRRDIALNWDGTPALVIETLKVSFTRFCDVDEEFALVEGENDSLDAWRLDHRHYFQRNGGFDPEMMLVCERFQLIEDCAVSN